nr:phage tail spike protein [uncultured Trichococcus sp.]
MSYAVLYKANETDFNTLGLGVLRDAISPLVTEERNGQFELAMSYPVDGALFGEIQNDRIIKADAGQKLKAQRFKIIRITKPAGGIVKVYAEHVSYLSQDLALKPSVSFNGNATQALTSWKNNIVDEHPFTIFSDVQTTGSGIWTIDKVENARRALGGVTGSILDTYGGEYRFDNHHIGLYANRGSDSGALIAYGKNLTDIEQEEEIANTYTSIYPYTNIRDEEGNESLLTLPEYFVDSEHTSNYARRKIKTVNFQQDDITTIEQLRERAQQYIVDNDIGVPSVNLTVKFVDLSKTLDYKDLALIEEINLCDQVTVYYDKLGIRQKAKVIKTVWNVALDRYEELIIGKAKANLSQSIGTTVDGKLETVVTDLNSVRISADGKTKIFIGVAEPVATNINDLWYKPVEDGGVEMYRWDGVIWGLQKSSAGALAGTIDFANIQAINIDANAITTGILSGSNMWLNLVTGEMHFTNPATGDVLVLDQGEIFFQNGANTRHLKYTSEGLKIVPGAGNTGTNLNTSIRLHGGITYIDFFNDVTGNVPESTNRARMESNGEYIYLRTANGEKVHVIDWGGEYRELVAGAFTTAGSNNPTYHYADRWETPRDGNRGLVASPNGTGKFYVSNPEQTAYYPVWASSFDVSSSIEFKKAIEDYTGNATELINGTPVRLYHLNEDVEGVDIKRIGLIVQESPLEVINPDGGKTIDLYEMASLLWKGNQELSAELTATKQELADLKNLLTDKGVI